jgi:hypothetical protein
MMSTLSIQPTKVEPPKVAVVQAPVVRQQQAPQTRAPAVSQYEECDEIMERIIAADKINSDHV